MRAARPPTSATAARLGLSLVCERARSLLRRAAGPFSLVVNPIGFRPAHPGKALRGSCTICLPNQWASCAQGGQLVLVCKSLVARTLHIGRRAAEGAKVTRPVTQARPGRNLRGRLAIAKVSQLVCSQLVVLSVNVIITLPTWTADAQSLPSKLAFALRSSEQFHQYGAHKLASGLWKAAASRYN